MFIGRIEWDEVVKTLLDMLEFEATQVRMSVTYWICQFGV
jgi:hypothetical protein